MASHIRLNVSASSRCMPRPKTVRGPFYDSLLARNLRALIAHQAEGSINVWAKRYEVNQSTLNRYCNGTTDATLGNLQDLLEPAHYQAWQLLHPDFDPRVMPPMLDARAQRVATIFSSIKSETDRDRAEAIMEQFAPDDLGVLAAHTSAEHNLHS